MFRSVIVLFVITAAGILASCSGSPAPAPSPIPPSPPTPALFALSGAVTSRSGPVPGALLEILDGADRTRTTMTGPDGTYRLSGLTPGSFGIRASLGNYVADDHRVTLQGADGTQDFRLTRPVLTFFDDLIVTEIPGHQYRFKGSMRNDGDACATNVRGIAKLSFNGLTVLSAPWSLDPARIVRPQEATTYEFCCLEDRYAGQTGSYTVTFEYVALAC